MRVEPLSMRRRDEMIVACVLNHPWTVVVGGEEFVFPPFHLFRVTTLDGQNLIDRATRTWEERRAQAQAEYKQWLDLVDSPKAKDRDRATFFCDENGKPRSKVFPCIPLVSLSSEEGKKLYEERLTVAKAEGKIAEVPQDGQELDLKTDLVPDPDAGSLAAGESKKFELDAAAEVEDGESASPRFQVDNDNGPDAPMKVERPRENWPESQLVRYCKSKGFAVGNMERNTPGKLLEIAVQAHEKHLQRLKASDRPYEEV